MAGTAELWSHSMTAQHALGLYLAWAAGVVLVGIFSVLAIALLAVICPDREVALGVLLVNIKIGANRRRSPAKRMRSGVPGVSHERVSVVTKRRPVDTPVRRERRRRRTGSLPISIPHGRCASCGRRGHVMP